MGPEAVGARLSFGVLGPLEVTRGGVALEVLGRRERALLAVLLVHANQVVSTATLLDEVWEHNPSESAGPALRVHVSRLRKALGAGGGAEVLETRAPGYVLHVDADGCDAGCFEGALARARTLGSAQPERTTAALSEALASWRGPAFADVAGPPCVAAEAARLEEARLGALEDRLGADLACGRHREVVGELEALVSTHPLRERLWAAWILALYRCGRQADALRAYQRLRAQLADELGIDPSPELRQLEQDILLQDPSLDLAAAAKPRRNTAGVVALLFTDLVSSTDTLQRLGDDAADLLRREHFAILRRAVEGHGGEEVKSLGDGLMAVFQSAVSALESAVAAQQGVARHNRLHPDRRMELRVGLHVGEPIRDEDDYFGTPVVVAARLCAAAVGGQILASGLLRSLIGSRGGFPFHDLGGLTLKGLSEPVAACEVKWGEQAAAAFPLPAPLVEEGAFVGRDSELARLAATWSGVEGGAREVVLVAGEPGIGKTSLVARAARAAHAAGAVVLFGHCDEESLIPFQPFVEALAHFVTLCPPEDLTAYLGERAADVALLVPELRRRLPDLDLPEASGTGHESERYRLFESVPAFLAAIAAENPVVLVLDDLHWADRPTVQLLIHTIRRTGTAPLLVLGTYRDTDLVRTHPMAGALVDLRRQNLVERIPLRGLARGDVAALVAGRGEPVADDVALADALWHESEGSPLFLREILRHLTDIEAVVATEDGGYRARRRIDQLGIPEGVKEVIGRRLTRLADDTNAVLRAASVMGREFRAEVVGEVIGATLDAVLDAMDEAAAAGVVAEVPGAVGSYAFTHALVRETLYGELSTTRRVRFHQAVGEAIEGLAGDDPGPYLSELAFHFAQAAVGGTAAKALDYGRRAAQQAFAGIAYEEAVRLYASALEVADEADAPVEDRIDLLLALGRAQWRAGAGRDARFTYVRAGDLARDLGDDLRLALAALGRVAADDRANEFQSGIIDQQGIDLLEEALAALPAGDSAVRSRLLAHLAKEIYMAPASSQRRRQLADEAVTMARRVGDRTTLANVVQARIQANYSPDCLDQRIDDAREMLALRTELRDPWLDFIGGAWLGVALIERGEIEEGLRQLAELEANTDALKAPDSQQIMHCINAALATLEGRFDDAAAMLAESLRVGQEARDANVFLWASPPLAMLGFHQGHAHQWLGPQAEMQEVYPGLASASTLLVYGALCEAGRPDEALEVIDHLAFEDPDVYPRTAPWLWGLGGASLGAFRAGHREVAARLYDLQLPFSGRIAVAASACILPVDLALAACAAVLQRWGDAERHLRSSRHVADRHGWETITPYAEYLQACVCAGRAAPDDLDRAEQHAIHAMESAERLGMAHIQRRASDLLAELRGGTPHTETTRVTRRDRARARLTGRGRSLVRRLTNSWPDEKLGARFASPTAQRALFAGMARSFQPAMAGGFTGDLTFELVPHSDYGDPRTSDWWTVEIRGHTAAARPGRSDSPALVFRTGLADFVRLACGDVGPLRLLVESRCSFEGDLFLASSLGEMFGAMEPFETPIDPPNATA